MTRFRGQGATWFRKRAESRRLNVESFHADSRDVGTRIDIAALLAQPIEEDFPAYDLDQVVAQRDFQARAHRWFIKT